MKALETTDKAFLLRVHNLGGAYFTYSPDVRGGSHAKMTDSNMPAGNRPRLHRLAVDGFVSERVAGCGGHGEPPETTWHFALTALGRQACGIHAEPAPPVHRTRALTDEELEAEGIE